MQAVRPSHIRTQSAFVGAAAAAAQDGPPLPKVATHNRSASALPTASAGDQAAAAGERTSPTKQDAAPANKVGLQAAIAGEICK